MLLAFSVTLNCDRSGLRIGFPGRLHVTAEPALLAQRQSANHYALAVEKQTGQSPSRARCDAMSEP